MTASDTSPASPRLYPDEIKQYWPQLEKKLLQLGGHAAQQPECDDHIRPIVEQGSLQKGRRVRKQGRLNECHANSCELWMRSKGKMSLCTGYALCSSGIWLQHSWCMSLPCVTNPRIFETTCEWRKYFGISLWELEAFRFVFASISKDLLGRLFDQNPHMRDLLKRAVERGQADGTFRLD